MESVFETAAIASAGLFAGAAFYVNFAEHPARMKLAPKDALAQWQPAYKRGAMMQATLAGATFLLSMAAFLADWDWRWLLGGTLVGVNWPYTFYVIMPLNKQLLATPPSTAGETVRKQLDQWNLLHAGRTLLGLGGLLLLCWAEAD
jgi:Anthrone oxygenase